MTDLKIAWAEAPEGHYVWRRLKRDHPHAMPGDRWFISRKDLHVLPTGYEFARAEQQPGEHAAELAALREELAHWKICGNCGEALEGPGHCGSAVTEHEKALELMHEETLTRAEQAEADLATLRAGIAALEQDIAKVWSMDPLELADRLVALRAHAEAQR